jgi:hypothetical protein
MRKNLPARSKNVPKSHLEAVLRFVKEKDIILNPEQERYMQRILYADELIRSRKYTRQQVINMIVTRFDVSKWRADEDVTDTHKVFGATRKISKGYILSFHLDDIQEQILLAKQARRLDLLPKLNDNLTYALNSLPPEEKESDRAPAKIVFIIKDRSNKTMDVDAILAEAEKLIKQDFSSNEYIDFEEQQ